MPSQACDDDDDVKQNNRNTESERERKREKEKKEREERERKRAPRSKLTHYFVTASRISKYVHLFPLFASEFDRKYLTNLLQKSIIVAYRNKNVRLCLLLFDDEIIARFIIARFKSFASSSFTSSSLFNEHPDYHCRNPRSQRTVERSLRCVRVQRNVTRGGIKFTTTRPRFTRRERFEQKHLPVRERRAVFGRRETILGEREV